MIQANSENLPYLVSVTNGPNAFVSDTTTDKGGSGDGFRPHELLEAALASCMNMTIRMFAEKYSIPLHSVSTTVELDRSNPDETIFNYKLDLAGPLSDDQRQHLIRAVQHCPVWQTLSKKLSFNDRSAI